jgi:polar amino acid transport system substrate-binding protein
MNGPVRHLLGLAVTAAVLAGCGTSSDHALRLAMSALETTTPTQSSQSSTTATCTDLTATLRPPATMPAAGHMPSGSFMSNIQHRGYLRAGVNAGLLDFGYLNPASGNIEGFEIDLVHEIAHAIFGDSNPNRVHLVALSVPQREDAVRSGRVDIVVDAVTITCARRQKVDFSSVYYDAKQRVLVPSNSPATDITAFDHQPVCATADSTPLDVLEKKYPQVIRYGAPQAIDCLVLMQEGKIPAISTDDSILLGFKEQDPMTTKIIGTSLADVPYGMEISKTHTDFVRFVNGVLAELERNGTWQALYNHWLGQLAAHPNPLPPAQYDG